jgi:hypothetical protein
MGSGDTLRLYYALLKRQEALKVQEAGCDSTGPTLEAWVQ